MHCHSASHTQKKIFSVCMQQLQAARAATIALPIFSLDCSSTDDKHQVLKLHAEGMASMLFCRR
jgi:hypothetical protein